MAPYQCSYDFVITLEGHKLAEGCDAVLLDWSQAAMKALVAPRRPSSIGRRGLDGRQQGQGKVPLPVMKAPGQQARTANGAAAGATSADVFDRDRFP